MRLLLARLATRLIRRLRLRPDPYTLWQVGIHNYAERSLQRRIDRQLKRNAHAEHAKTLRGLEKNKEG